MDQQLYRVEVFSTKTGDWFELTKDLPVEHLAPYIDKYKTVLPDAILRGFPLSADCLTHLVSPFVRRDKASEGLDALNKAEPSEAEVDEAVRRYLDFGIGCSRKGMRAALKAARTKEEGK